MKKLSNTEAELKKKSVAYKKSLLAREMENQNTSHIHKEKFISAQCQPPPPLIYTGIEKRGVLEGGVGQNIFLVDETVTILNQTSAWCGI